MFGCTFQNLPKSELTLKDHITQRGGIESFFKSFGAIGFLVVEFEIDDTEDYLNAVTKVIAECHGQAPDLCSLSLCVNLLTLQPVTATTHTKGYMIFLYMASFLMDHAFSFSCSIGTTSCTRSAMGSYIILKTFMAGMVFNST